MFEIKGSSCNIYKAIVVTLYEIQHFSCFHCSMQNIEQSRD